MGHTSYYFFVTDTGLERISKRVLEALTRGADSIPKYANTKQRFLAVYVETEGGKPVTIERAQGEWFKFDEDGKVHKALVTAMSEAMNTFGKLAESKADEGKTVVSLTPTLDRKRWQEEHRWEPDKAILDRVADAIWPKPGSSQVPFIEGAAEKRPALTYEAKEALDKLRTAIFDIGHAMDRLAGPGLKGLAAEARRMAPEEDYPTQPLFIGIAEHAERRLEILNRHRSGKGVWWAVVEAIVWEGALRHTGRGDTLAEVECASLKEAEKEARRLLITYAGYFNERTTIEAHVFTDLEWTPNDPPRLSDPPSA